MKYFTGTGDYGETSLMGGKRVFKDNIRIEACGEIDEFNSFLGFLRSICKYNDINEIIKKIQLDLFIIGAELATNEEFNSRIRIPRIKKENVKEIEKYIEGFSKEIEPINKFIIPGETELASFFHIVRTVCRRAERTIVKLSKEEKINENIIAYINRLSSLFFVLARVVNKREGKKEFEVNLEY